MPRKREWPKSVTVGSVVVKVYEVSHPTNASGKAYVVSYRTPGGRKTGKFANPDAAMEEARLQAEKLAAGKIEAAEMTGGEHEELIAARELAGNTPLLAALREWREANRLSNGNILTAVRFYSEHFKAETRRSIITKVAVELFMKAKEDEGVDTASSYAKVLPRLRDSELAELPIDSIGKDQLADWIASAFKTEGADRVHPETFNTARRRCVTLWKWARDEGYLPKLVKTAAEEIKTRVDKSKYHEPIGIMTVADWKASLALIRDEHPALLATLVIGGFCGLRRSELMAQKWADIDHKRGILRVTKAKARTPARRLVPISAAAKKWLAICNQNSDTIGPSWASDHVRSHLRAAKIQCPDNAFRHSFISYRCAETGSVDRTAQEAGNSPKVVFSHYRELVTQREGKAWFSTAPD